MKNIVTYVLTGLLLISCNSGTTENTVSHEKSLDTQEVSENAPQKTKTRQSTEYKSEAPMGSTYAVTDNMDAQLAANQTSTFIVPDAPKENLTTDRKIIWYGHLVFAVDNINTSFDKIRKLCKTHSGYISDMERTASDDEISNEITIRVNSEHFHDLVQAIKGQSIHLDVASVNSEDVTEEFVDIRNRLKTKRNARERYIEILRTKTGTIQDVIEAEDAIRRITEEIEAKEGRLRYLNDQLNFSTITIRMYKTLSPKVYAKTAITYTDRTQNAFASGWNFIKEFTLVMIRLWPLLLVLGAIFLWKRKWLVKTMQSWKKRFVSNAK